MRLIQVNRWFLNRNLWKWVHFSTYFQGWKSIFFKGIRWFYYFLYPKRITVKFFSILVCLTGSEENTDFFNCYKKSSCLKKFVIISVKADILLKVNGFCVKGGFNRTCIVLEPNQHKVLYHATKTIVEQKRTFKRSIYKDFSQI